MCILPFSGRLYYYGEKLLIIQCSILDYARVGHYVYPQSILQVAF